MSKEMRKYITSFNDFLLWNKKIIGLNEYLSSHLAILRDYIKSSKDEKIRMLPKEYPYLFNDFQTETGSTLKNQKEINPDSIIEWLERNDKKTYFEFGKYLYDKIKNNDLPIEERYYPSWHYFEFPELIKNQWLVHFTSEENAKSISKWGFSIGFSEPKILGATTQFLEYKESVGYNFAFLLSDFADYYSYFTRYGPQPKYGTSAVIFKASGIRVWHNRDQEYQVIFYGKEAKDIVAITHGKKSWAVWDKNGEKVVYENDDIQKVTDWVAKNYYQYRRHI